MDRQKIGTALQGLGAHLDGRGIEYQRNQMAEREQAQILDEQRKQEMLEDAYMAYQVGATGNIPGTLDVLYKRFDRIRQDPSRDPSDTLGLIKQFETDPQGAMTELGALVDHGFVSGRLQMPPAGQRDRMQVVGDQIVNMDTGSASDIAGFDNTQANEKLALDRRRVANAEAIEARQQVKLSSGLEKVLLDSQQASIDRQGDAVNFNTIAQEFETRSDEFYGGVGMTVNEGLKALLGSQDDVTEFRRKINAIRVAEGIGQLPPGVASDKDIELVMSGQIRENAGPEQVASYLRGAAKAAQYAAGYNQMRVDFINKNRKGAGLNNAWRKMHTSSKLGREVSAAEIYRGAMNKGITVEDAMEMLGVSGELF